MNSSVGIEGRGHLGTPLVIAGPCVKSPAALFFPCRPLPASPSAAPCCWQPFSPPLPLMPSPPPSSPDLQAAHKELQEQLAGHAAELEAARVAAAAAEAAQSELTARGAEVLRLQVRRGGAREGRWRKLRAGQSCHQSHECCAAAM